LYLAHSHKFTLHLDLRSQKSLALFVVLGLSLGALVFASGEARAAQQHPTVVQHSPTEVQQFSEKTSGEYSAATYKEGAEPVTEAPSIVSYPVGTLFSAPPLFRGSTPKPLPNPTPEPALQPPAPDSLQKPVSKVTREPTRPEDPEPMSGKSVSALLQNPAPPVPLGREVPDPLTDPHSSEPTLPISEPLPEPVPELDALKAEPVPLEAEPGAFEEVMSEPLPREAKEAPVKKALEPYWMIAPLPENVLANSGGSPEPSYNDAQKPLKDTPQPPEPPLVPPGGDSILFSLGGAQVGHGGALALLLICIFSSGLVLLRPNGKLSLARCILPKPRSALQLPLERPG
jgi:hypothetical protein